MEIDELFCKRYPEYSVNGKPLSPYFDVFEEGYEQAEKENAELKEELKKWKDEWQEQVQKAIDEGYARTQQTIQLTKAKELIKGLLDLPDLIEDRTSEHIELIGRAEQFLEVEV